MPEAATETTVELNGVRLYTRRVGHGPPVVVLHGGPGAHHDYLLPQYDHLAEGGRALLYYDQRGGGRSPVPRDVPVGWREHVADLEALRVYWELDRLTVVGYSWGGMGEPGELRPAPAHPADLSERHRSPLPAAARRVRPHAPRGRARDRGAALHGRDRAGYGACAARRGDGGVRAGAGRVPASRLSR